MKIAFLGARGIPATHGGFETVFEQISFRLVDKGHNVTVYCRNHHYKERPKTYRGVSLVHLPSIASKHLDTIVHTFFSLIHALCTKHDIYYICVVGNSPLCLLAKLFGKKVIINVDGADAEREKWKFFAKLYIKCTERIASRFAHTIIADSTVIKKRYKKLFGRDTVFIPYGSNVWPRIKEKNNLTTLNTFNLKTDEYILFAGRLIPENGIHFLIEAFKKSNTNLKLVILGDAPYMADYKQFIKSQCDENIIMTGYLFNEKFREVSCHCRFFILPSPVDGTRPVLLDQMGFGNCVLVLNTPANMEVIGDSALYFEKDNFIESLTEKIDYLSKEYNVIELYRMKAIERMESTYTWDSTTEKHEALFKQVLSS